MNCRSTRGEFVADGAGASSHHDAHAVAAQAATFFVATVGAAAARAAIIELDRVRCVVTERDGGNAWGGAADRAQL